MIKPDKPVTGQPKPHVAPLPWYRDIVKSLRRAAYLTDDEDLESWFTSTVDLLETSRPCRNLDEIMIYAEREIARHTAV
jgi:hypothetical protein